MKKTEKTKNQNDFVIFFIVSEKTLVIQSLDDEYSETVKLPNMSEDVTPDDVVKNIASGTQKKFEPWEYLAPIVQKMADMKASKHSFSYFTPEDIKQEILLAGWLIKDKINPKKISEGELVAFSNVSIERKLKNLKRDRFISYESKPCNKCEFNESDCDQIDSCLLYKAYQEKIQFKKDLHKVIPHRDRIESENEEPMSFGYYDNELADSIKDELSRKKDNGRLLNVFSTMFDDGVKLDKRDLKEIRSIARQILREREGGIDDGSV